MMLILRSMEQSSVTLHKSLSSEPWHRRGKIQYSSPGKDYYLKTADSSHRKIKANKFEVFKQPVKRTSTNYRQSLPSFRCTYAVFHITNLKWGCWARECLGWQSWNFAVQSPDPDPPSLGAFRFHINKMICKIVKKCLTMWSIRKSTTDLTSNIAGCKLVPAGCQRQL